MLMTLNGVLTESMRGVNGISYSISGVYVYVVHAGGYVISNSEISTRQLFQEGDAMSQVHPLGGR